MPSVRFRAQSALGLVPFLLVAALTLNPAFAQAVPTPSSAITDTPAPRPSPTTSAVPQPISVHAQVTQVQQYHGEFPAQSSGTNSLSNMPDTAKTISADLYLGVRLGSGTEFYLNPEIDQGFGLGNPGAPGSVYTGTVGAGGFVSGEAYKVGSNSSYGRLQRAFLRQTIMLGGDRSTIDAGIDQLAGSATANYLRLTAGKFSVTDVFDANVYAHDPTNDFLNWSIIDMGAFDYAADAWGFTYGASAELAMGTNTIRAGLFQLSKQPNQIAIEPQPLLQYSPMLEFEHDTSLFGGRPGALKSLVYADDGYMGAYADAVDAAQGTGLPPNTALVRDQRHVKVGGGVNVAQEVAPYVGVFARASFVNGTYEAYDFTEIDRSLSGGLSINGGLFHRPNDTFGLAGAINGLSAPAQEYFAAGGIGILIGDGDLSYTPERIAETYYKVGLGALAAITFDYQRLAYPAYNLARGPVSIFGIRYHVQW
jgi:high affinity Mn2+ porin